MEHAHYSELARKAYDQCAARYHELFRNEMGQKEFDRNFLDRLSDLLPENSAICDAGCGPSGHIGKYLFDKGHRVTGIDISPKCIEIARSYQTQLTFEARDMAATGFEDNTFDAVVSYYSILYSPKEFTDLMVKEFYRILKPGGLVLIVVKKGNTESMVDDYWETGLPVYFTLFEELELEDSLKRCKFDDIKVVTRKPYDFEYAVDRIYALGRKEK